MNDLKYRTRNQARADNFRDDAGLKTSQRYSGWEEKLIRDMSDSVSDKVITGETVIVEGTEYKVLDISMDELRKQKYIDNGVPFVVYDKGQPYIVGWIEPFMETFKLRCYFVYEKYHVTTYVLDVYRYDTNKVELMFAPV